MTNRILCSLALAAALIVGCDDKKDNQPAPKADTNKTPTVDDVKKGVDNATKTITDKTNTATDTAKTATAGATDEAKKNASEWMTKLETAIKDNKLDEAKTYIDKLQAIRDQLPDDLKSKFDAVKATYDAAKAKGNLPGLPK